MKDRIGQEIVVGATVLWGGGKGQYAELPKGRVTKITDKRVTVVFPHPWLKEATEEKSLASKTLVVVDRLLEGLHNG